MDLCADPARRNSGKPNADISVEAVCGGGRVSVAAEGIETGLDDHEKRILAAELNVARRQLTDAQKIQHGWAIEPDFAARAKMRMLSVQNNKTGEAIRNYAHVRIVANDGTTRDEVARTVQIGSGDTYTRGKEVLAELEQEPDGKQLMTHVDNGDWAMQEAGPASAFPFLVCRLLARGSASILINAK